MILKVIFCTRNSATEAVQQELLFVGQESGKLLAMRNMVKKVSTTWNIICTCIVIGVMTQ